MKKRLLFLRHLQSLLERQSQQMGNNSETQGLVEAKGVGNQRREGVYSLTIRLDGMGDGKKKLGGFGHISSLYFTFSNCKIKP